MDLQEHTRAETIRQQILMDAEQRDLHDVRRAPLNGSVESGSLRVLAQHPVGAGQVRERAPTSEDRLGVTHLLRGDDGRPQVVADGAEPGKVLEHELLGLGLLDPQLLRQTESAQPVHEPVGHRLDLGAHQGGDVVRLDTEDSGADETVQVFAGVEGLDQAFVAGQVRHDTHLDLRVVRGKERFIALAYLERRTDAPRLLRANRDVLQIRIGAGEPAGLTAGLDVGRVDAMVFSDRGVQRLDDLTQLRGLAMLEEQPQERMRVRLLQVGEHGGIGGVARLGLARLRQLEILEQDLLQLFGGTEVHLAPDDAERLLRDAVGAFGELSREARQLLVRDGDPRQLHVGERAQSRQLDLAENAIHALRQVGTKRLRDPCGEPRQLR
ncbi:hypothetical protein ABE10_02875, partial [Bacillus toyonensis]|nr:hypothetical protein [Bacillus toyonensis]